MPERRKAMKIDLIIKIRIRIRIERAPQKLRVRKMASGFTP